MARVEDDERLGRVVESMTEHILVNVMHRKHYSGHTAVTIHDLLLKLVKEELNRDRRRRIADAVRESM